MSAVVSPLQGTVVRLHCAEGDLVASGDPLVVIESMKMEHVVPADANGSVRSVAVAVGDDVVAGQVVVDIEPADVDAVRTRDNNDAARTERSRRDLLDVDERHAAVRDDARPAAVARRRSTGQRTARENIADLCDDSSFVEYGPLVIAAQRRRRTVEDLVENTPADGMIAGLGRVHGAPVAVLAYDYTVLAGTQGVNSHRKVDRVVTVAKDLRIPLVVFTEGGGGRPGDTDAPVVHGLDTATFHLFAGLSGDVPIVAVNSRYCFAGNAALLGCADVVIATENSSIGMGGPAMIEGGGLGVVSPQDVGPMSVQVANGVVDVAVADEAEAVDVARRYLSYFVVPQTDGVCPDQTRLRDVVPERRTQAYDVRSVITSLADTASVLELRPEFGRAAVTALVRIDGRAVGVVANNPMHLGGAIDADAADKAARFMQLCDAFALPILFLCDTPGIMVGPDSEKRATVRHCSRLFVTGANLSVPYFTIVLRKGYGLGAQAMAGGSFVAPLFIVSWPTGEFGGMGLEGAVKLGFRRELEAITDPAERERRFDEMVEAMYRRGAAVNTAMHFEVDDVIDPADSRSWITTALAAVPVGGRLRERRHFIDTW